MGKLNGILAIEGSVGRITFAKGEDGVIVVREKTGVSAERIATEKNFERTRQNNAEFGNAGKAAKLIYTAFRSGIRASADSKAVSRLMRRLMEVVHADSINPKGLRTVATGDLMLLEGFQFNRHGDLNASFSAPYTVTVTRSSGTLAVSIPPFVPMDEMDAPAGATHFKIKLSGAELNFADNVYVSKTASSTTQTLGSAATSTISLSTTVTTASTEPLVMALSVSYYIDTNGTLELVNNSTCNAMAIIKVDV